MISFNTLLYSERGLKTFFCINKTEPMKQIAVCLFLVIFINFFITCKRIAPTGKWEDRIQLSGKDFTFNTTGDSVLITAKGSWWGINCVYLDSTAIQINTPSNDYCNFTYADSNMKIVSSNCKSLIVKMNANNTNKDRTLCMTLWAGDYYDGVRILQKKK